MFFSHWVTHMLSEGPPSWTGAAQPHCPPCTGKSPHQVWSLWPVWAPESRILEFVYKIRVSFNFFSLHKCLRYLPMAIFAQVTAGSGWPSALQLRLTVVPALTLIVPGPLVSMILADSKCIKWKKICVHKNNKVRNCRSKINIYNTPKWT